MKTPILKIFHKFNIFKFDDITNDRIEKIVDYLLFVEYKIKPKKVFLGNNIYFDVEKYKYGYDKLYICFSKDKESPAFIMNRKQIDLMIFNILNGDINNKLIIKNLEKSSRKKWIYYDNKIKLVDI
jgi:hypothetical protein